MSKPPLLNDIIIAALNNTNGIILALTHSAAVYCLKTGTAVNTLYTSPLGTTFHWNNSIKNFPKTPFWTGTAAALPASHSTQRRHFCLPSRNIDIMAR